MTFLSQRLLRRGFTVTATTSGPDAVAAADRQPFDVAVVDLKLPVMDGVEVLGRLKAGQPFLEAIMFTGHGSADSALEAGRLDAFRYVIKPCDYEELVALIEAAGRRKRERQTAAYHEALQEILAGGGSPREILAATEALRHQYEQDDSPHRS